MLMNTCMIIDFDNIVCISCKARSHERNQMKSFLKGILDQTFLSPRPRILPLSGCIQHLQASCPGYLFPFSPITVPWSALSAHMTSESFQVDLSRGFGQDQLSAVCDSSRKCPWISLFGIRRVEYWHLQFLWTIRKKDACNSNDRKLRLDWYEGCRCWSKIWTSIKPAPALILPWSAHGQGIWWCCLLPPPGLFPIASLPLRAGEISKEHVCTQQWAAAGNEVSTSFQPRKLEH